MVNEEGVENSELDILGNVPRKGYHGDSLRLSQIIQINLIESIAVKFTQSGRGRSFNYQVRIRGEYI